MLCISQQDPHGDLNSLKSPAGINHLLTPVTAIFQMQVTPKSGYLITLKVKVLFHARNWNYKLHGTFMSNPKEIAMDSALLFFTGSSASY